MPVPSDGMAKARGGQKAVAHGSWGMVVGR